MTALHPPAPPGLATPTGPWRKLSAAMTTAMPAIAGRPVPVACAPGAGLGSPACYLPDIPVIEVDGALLGIAPATADPASPADRERYPVLWGALTHEAGHAAHSKTCPPPADKANWCQAAHQLEESRMEAAHITRRPGDRRWLRATVSKLILGDFTTAGATPGTPREAGSAAALILAREHAGILEPAETATVTARVAKVIGADTLRRLADTWKAAHQVADDDARTMVTLARRWCRILGLDPDAPPPAPIMTGVSDLLDAIRDAIKAISAAVEADFTPPPPFPPGRTADRDAENTARTSAGRAAREVFARRTTPPAVTGTREPAGSEKAAARRLTRTLRDATAGQRATVTITSPAPPGRLRMRHVLAADAQRAAGARPTAEPFTRTRSRRVPAPPLRAGIACDISRSMTDFTGPVASAAWILARAAAALPAATTATVLYGEQVHALTHPGHAPARIADFAAPDGTEQLCRAIDALDGALVERRSGFRCRRALAALGMPMWRVRACARVSAHRRRHRADGRRAGCGGCRGRVAPRGCGGGVAGGAGGLHGGRVGCGAALPVIFWRSPGRAAGLTLGGVVLTVNGDRDVVERQLADGELACPSCGGVLGGWGNARLRRVRVARGPDAVLVPRRSRCRECGATHVLLPAWCLLRRADAAVVVGAALEAAASGEGYRKIAGRLGRAVSTVRAWLRRFAGRAEVVRVFFTVLLARAGPDPVMPAGAAGPVAAAVSAIAGAVVAVAARWPRLGEVPVWVAASAASGGLLLAPGWPGGGRNAS